MGLMKTERPGGVSYPVKTLIIVILILMIPGSPSLSQDSGNSVPDRRVIVETIIDCFDRHYVLPEIIPVLKDTLCDNLEKGRYSDAKNTESLLYSLSRDLRLITGDKHVRLNYIEKSGRTAGQYGNSILEPSVQSLEQVNYDFRKVEWLPGNIGYLRFDSFRDPAYAGEKLTSAISYLDNCDAIILDLRYNGGGKETMVKFVASYFFEKPTLINQMYFSRQDSLWQTWTSEYVPGKKLADKPLYILTGPNTASAAEAFSYSLQKLGRATIIGETSRGAAHWVDFFYFPELHMEIKLPVAMPVNPVTKTNWEKTGVIPDIRIAEHLAFETAYLTALKTIASRIDDKVEKSNLEWFINITNERLKNEPLHEIKLEEYAGKYENLEFIIRNGQLLWYGGEGEEYVIVPISRDNFMFTDTNDYIIKFIRNEKGEIGAY